MAHSFSTYGRNISKIWRAIDLLARPQEPYRAFAGDGIFRFSTGLEDLADIVADLQPDSGIAAPLRLHRKGRREGKN